MNRNSLIHKTLLLIRVPFVSGTDNEHIDARKPFFVTNTFFRPVRGSAPIDSIVRKLFALIARCHQMLGDLAAALNACSEGLRIDPYDAEMHIRKAVLQRRGRWPRPKPAGGGP